ncbi:MAG TPA: PQQ-binding-like beta-propeller repeat protein, partial [Fimbriimonas sp.]|nr:PQQ-binding-like beta-propeller repeat protein [Fimbriimonas sp.]
MSIEIATRPWRRFTKMFGNRSLLTVVLAAVGATGYAQLDGPAPLAWRWQQSASVAPNGSPTVDGNSIYYNVGNRVYSIDRGTGNTIWKYPNGAPLDGTVKRSPVLVNGVLVMFTDQRKVYGIDPQTGQSKWVYEAPFQISSPLVAAGRFVVFAMDGGNIMSVDSVTGEGYNEGPLRMLDGIGGPLFSDGRDTIAFFDNRNGIRAISASTRGTLWTQQFGVRPA